MEYHVNHHKKAGDKFWQRCGGFSIIEMIVAVFILSIGMLALMTLTLTSMEVNLENDIRDTAVRLTGEVSEMLLAQDFCSVTSGGLTPYDGTNTALLPDWRQYPSPVQKVRSATLTYNVTWVVTSTGAVVCDEVSPTLKQITITVELLNPFGKDRKRFTNVATFYKTRKM